MNQGIIIPPKRNQTLEPGSFEIVEPANTRGYPVAYSSPEQHPLFNYWRILKKHRWSALATLTIVFVLTAIATMKMTRLYEADSRVAIFPENPNALGLKDMQNATDSAEYDYNVALETQISILRSDELALKVIEALHLDQNSGFARVKGGGQSAPSATPLGNIDTDEKKVAGLLRAFHTGLSVQAVPRTRIVDVHYVHPDARLAAQITNTLVKTFIEQNFRTKYESATQTSEWLSSELADLQLKVETSEEKLVRYQKNHGILGIDEKQNIVTAKLDELNKELTSAEADRIQKESNYKLASSGDPSAFTKLETGNLLEKLKGQEADLQSQYAELTTQFGPSYPRILELDNQLKQVRSSIAAEEHRLLTKVRGEYLAAAQREKMLSSVFEQQKNDANRLNESAIEYSSLKRDADSNRQLYQSLLQRLKEAGVTAGLRSNNIRVVDVARTPTFPSTPNVPRNLALGLILGIAGGVGLAFVLETLDNTVRNIEEISAISALPALGTIPLQIRSNGAKRKGFLTGSVSSAKNDQPELSGLVAYARPKSEAAESFRALRTSILLSAFGAPPKIILVTSALPQEGKTTISANSAMVLAQRGSRVLLVDADMRRPGVDRILSIKANRGLSTLLSGIDLPKDVIVQFPKIPNLWVLPAGPIPPQPVELLASTVMKDYIAAWRDEFDHVIIDSPPCLSVTDAVVLSVAVDRVVLVARSGQTPKAALRRACDLLMQVNASVMGVVLNAFDVHSADSYYYNYGGKYGGHYYDQTETPEHNAHAS